MRWFLSTALLIGFLAASVPSAFAQFVISEFMADNFTSADVDEDTNHSDWLEIQNNGASDATLNGWYLTDDATQLRKWQFPVTTPVVSVPPSGRIIVWASNKNRKAVATKLHTNFKLNNSGEYLALVRPDGTTVEHGYSPMFPAQFPNGTYGIAVNTSTQILLPEISPGKALSPLSLADYNANFVGWNSVLAFNDTGWQAGTAGFGFSTIVTPPASPSDFTALIGAGANLGTMMRGITTTCFIRYQFNYTPGALINATRLKLKFDDGYVAYLNGTQVASSSAPSIASLTWNSAATTDRPDSLAPLTSSVTLAGGGSLLVSGTNLLAFHLLNKAATEMTTATPAVNVTNVLMRAQLEIDTITGTSLGYLSSATKGAVNSAIKTAVGPAISKTTDKPTQPTGGVGSAPLVITTTIGTTLRPLAASAPVTLRWRRMYENETSVTMVDNGTNGDVTANDKIYTASVPTTTLLPGEMIRWRIVAKDNGASPSYSYDPPYPGFSATSQPSNPTPDATTEAEQYFGTMTLPTNMVGSTTLPVLHWFLTGTDNTVNDIGTRCSFFWQPLAVDHPPVGYVPPKPRFYDNVLVNIHGQSTQGFPKKSHDMSFGKDNRFLWKDGTPETSGVNLLSNYADRSKVRNDTAWWVWGKSGHLASHYASLVRVQQNGVFKGLYDMVENANSSWLQRQGLDEAGALYKMYNSLDSVSGAEKKNPDDTDTTDLAALINGISQSVALTDRMKYLYDNVNVPGLVNFLAVHSIILNTDVGHKNYYVYRDTHGTQEWTMLPWDQDLSLGHTFSGNQGYFDDDIHSQAGLQIGYNQLIQLAFITPELNNMFVRRLRSLADQFYGSPTETNGPMIQHINAIIAQIDPVQNNTASGTDDADLEARAFGFWVDGYAGGQFAYTDINMADNTARVQAARITNYNPIPPNPGGTFSDGTPTTFPFVTGRRDYFYSVPPPVSPNSYGGQSLPGSQVTTPPLIIEQFTVTPTTGVYQNQEYFVIRNPNAYAVDLSGWKIGGDLNLTFQGGTIIPALGTGTTQATNASYVNQLVVANSPAGFRTRTTSPKGSEYRLVSGPYDHQLSARGGSITLNRPNDPFDPTAGYTQVQAVSYTGTPTSFQQNVRITELNFRPAPATSGELAALPGLVGGDFEFVELLNSGPSTLDLGGAYFEEGIEFTFPKPFLLASNQRCVVVASQSAFQIRYGNSHLIAGEFQGSLDNGGETLRLLDPYGEEILNFAYDDDWYPVPTGQYRSFVINTPIPAYSSYGTHAAWALSDQPSGSPSTGDTVHSVVYEGWRYDYFSDAELPTGAAPNLPAALTADPDHDGCSNFDEYAFGSIPTSPNSRVEATPGTTDLVGVKYLTLTFKRPINAIDLTYIVECSTSLTADSWQLEAVPVGAPVAIGNGLEQLTYRDTVAYTAASRRFMRATATK